MEEQLEEQSDKPWLFKAGFSGNPKGRPVGRKSLKVWVREKLEAMNDEERIAFMKGMNKDLIWRMAEGNPEAKTDITTKGESLNKPTKEDLALAEALNKLQQDGDNSGTSEQGTGIDASPLGSEISD